MSTQSKLISGVQPWSEEAHLEVMKTLSIQKSIISISSPGTHLVPGDDALARKVTRECNDYAADLCRRRPKEFGFWASLPLPDVTGALEEIPYALDTLHADGFALETNHHGLYLGDSTFDPVFAELNRRKAKIFIHPTQPCIPACNTPDGKVQPASPLMAFPRPMFEFMFDTARAVINLFLTGTVARCPDITFIIPHCGGALPPLVDRFTGFATMILGLEFEMSGKLVKETFARQFYFDLAGFPWPDQIFGLLRLVDSSRLLYGSDFPFTPPKGLVGMAESMATGMEMTFPNDLQRKMVLLGNAQRMLGLEKTSHT